MSITDPSSLNKYESFTSATYGETNFKQMAEIIDELRWSKSDVFVDLGSGIGSIVMQVSKTVFSNFTFIFDWLSKSILKMQITHLSMLFEATHTSAFPFYRTRVCSYFSF